MRSGKSVGNKEIPDAHRILHVELAPHARCPRIADPGDAGGPFLPNDRTVHGLIVNQLQRFLVTRFGRDTWTAVAAAAAEQGVGVLGDSVPAIDKVYPDALVFALVGAAVERTGVDTKRLLRDFGVFLAPALLRVYEPLVQPGWRTLDVLEHTEERIHTAVRLRDPKAGPPYLSARRVSAHEVHIVYTSARRLCAVAEGIAAGIAHHFGEALHIEQPECLYRGDARCLIAIRLTSEP